jgi:hypothetical protein
VSDSSHILHQRSERKPAQLCNFGMSLNRQLLIAKISFCLPRVKQWPKETMTTQVFFLSATGADLDGDMHNNLAHSVSM